MSQLIAGVKKRRINEAISEEETANSSGICDESSQWCNLPSIAVEKIYSFLDSNNDRYQMSLTCKNWSKGFSSAGLWRKVNLTLIAKDSTLHPAVTFVEKNFHVFKHVEIVYIRTATFLTNHRQHRQPLSDLLEVLALARLSTFVLKVKPVRDMSIESESTLHSFDVPFLLSFLRSQKHLTAVEFHDAYFDGKLSSSILDIFCTDGMRGLKNLMLTNFSVSSFSLYKIRLDCLMYLEVLEIDYSLLFLSFISSFLDKILPENIQAFGNLKELRIRCLSGLNPEIGIEVQSLLWIGLKNTCPHLKVKINSILITNDEEFSLEQIRLVATPEIPLTQLNISFYSSPLSLPLQKLLDPLMAIDTICQLETVQISWPYDSQRITKPVSDFVRSCPNLRELSLQFRQEVKDFGMLFDLWLKDRPQSLEKLDLKLPSVVEENIKSSYTDLEKKYVPLLKERNIQLRIGFTEKELPIEPHPYPRSSNSRSVAKFLNH